MVAFSGGSRRKMSPFAAVGDGPRRFPDDTARQPDLINDVIAVMHEVAEGIGLAGQAGPV